MAASSTKVVTGKVRLSYCHLFEAHTSFDKAQPKFSTVILVPKSDKKTVKAILDAQKVALEQGKASKFNGRIPKAWKNTFRDGDDEDSLEKNPEYAGHWFMTVSNATRPGIVDKDMNTIIDSTEVYSGCYARVSINAFPFNANGTMGVSFGLNNLQKIADGEPFGNISKAEDDFEPLDEDDLDDDGDSLL